LLEFGKKPYNPGENGGIRGHVVYTSTRPFDDPALLLQLTWEPQVPHVKINLYKEGFAADGVTPTLTLVDTTETSSWDDWAQGFRSDGVPNMNCPGQNTADPFYNVTLLNQPSYLNWYNAQHGGSAVTPLPNGSQYKCYDGMHNWNQLQPAPYDGMYSFPSVTGTNPATGKPTATNCTICTQNTAAATTDWNYNLPMLPAGKYVVEMVGRGTHRSRLHEPLPRIGTERALCWSYSETLRSQRSDPGRPDVGAGEVLRLQLHPRRRQI